MENEQSEDEYSTRRNQDETGGFYTGDGAQRLRGGARWLAGTGHLVSLILPEPARPCMCPKTAGRAKHRVWKIRKQDPQIVITLQNGHFNAQN